MKLIRSKSRKIAFFLSLSFLFVSCSDENIIENHQSKYSGEDIFNGLFFFKNDISEGIPQLAHLKYKIQEAKNYNEIRESMDEFSKLSVDFINSHYPEFFNDLQKKVYSGNLYSISAVLDQASKYIEQAGLSSDKYRAVFLMGKKISNDDNLRKQISELDLSTSEGMDKFKAIIDNNNGTNINGKNTCITSAFAAALAVAYVGVVAVSIAVGAYSVYFKVAYWGPQERIPVPDDLLHDDGGVRIERERFIAQTGEFFSN
ncbi:hypothetical protein [Flavobacterium sp. HTF]|uniref:hypothetical protein n=1 Tax=Flavobacterium sp. HTF TaxID=2170732 RepID=UPI000F4EAB6C|nr:hypothetical protein [Flavobacterium sp. HTF]